MAKKSEREEIIDEMETILLGLSPEKMQFMAWVLNELMTDDTFIKSLPEEEVYNYWKTNIKAVTI